MRLEKELVEKLIHRYERYVAPVLFIGGFLFDTFAMRRVDFWIDHIILILYLIASGFCIIFISARESGKIHAPETVLIMAPVVMQFAFGGLFSAFVIFYTKSAEFAKSWMFLLALIVFWIGNEHFRKRYQRLVFRLAIFYITVFSYAIFALPLVLRRIGAEVFLWSGSASIFVIVFFIAILRYSIAPRQMAEAKKAIFFSIGGIYILFNILYFTNIIPPIPLSLKEDGVYHLVRKDMNAVYELSFEPASKYLFWEETNSVYHRRAGEPVYFFSSIFAPIKFDLPVIHRWYYYDEQAGKWLEKENIKFSITGGRDGGYRGYSFKTEALSGKWRVDVLTESGQVIGGKTFFIVDSEKEPDLKFRSE